MVRKPAADTDNPPRPERGKLREQPSQVARSFAFQLYDAGGGLRSLPRYVITSGNIPHPRAENMAVIVPKCA